VLILLGLGVYLFFSEVARIEHAFQVVSTLKIPLVALSMGAQVLSYLASGYLLRAVVKLAAKPISVVDGALLTAGAHSVAAYLEAWLVSGQQWFASAVLVPRKLMKPIASPTHSSDQAARDGG